VDKKQVIVVGCGVSGLTSAIRLLESGYAVAIWARDLPPNTTSNVAAAIWEPYRAYPVDKITEWGRFTYEVFRGMVGVPETGVALVETIELSREPLPDPSWSTVVRGFRRLGPEEIPAGYVDGYAFETPVIETDIYMDYLVSRFSSLGGDLVHRELASLDEALAEGSIIVNCSGLGARSLVKDESLFPIRGQVVRVARPEGVDKAYLDDDQAHGMAYIVPRSKDCILGGTAQAGNWSLEVDPEIARGIIERCARLAPEVAEAEVLGHKVGLRPGRPTVRLESERTPGGALVVHNYGHGGAGVTLSWGCAEEVLSLVGAGA
jgi:D-amino-acid oxidase